MSDKDKSLKDQETFRKTLNQALGLNLDDEVTTKLMNGEDLSLDELSKHHTLTEIGTVLIRLDALSLQQTEESNRFCIPFRGIKICIPTVDSPAPRERPTKITDLS